MHIETVRVKPWGKDQGDFVEINACDFDPKFHTLFAADPLDHDGDGRKGGSRSRAKKVAV